MYFRLTISYISTLTLQDYDNILNKNIEAKRGETYLIFENIYLKLYT